MDGVARFHRRVGRGAGVEHLLPAVAMVVAARHRALHRVDRAVLRGPAQLLRGPFGPFGEDVSEALAVGDDVDELARALHVAPLQVEAELLLRDVALLHALHHPAAHPSELVHIETRAIELRVEPRDALGIREADGPAGARPAFVLRLVHDRALVIATANHLHVAVMPAARLALVTPMLDAS